MMGTVYFRRGSFLGRASFVLWCCAVITADAGDKEIKLRSERIRTSPGSANFHPAGQLHSGLLLIQFSGPISDAQKDELKGRGVKLLHYVPDDAFVARVRETSLAELLTLPYIHWAGEYKKEHKSHTAIQQKEQRGEAAEVTIMLAPETDPAETATVRSCFAELRSESRFRSAAVWRGRVAPGQLKTLSASPNVLWIEPTPDFVLADEPASQLVAGVGPNHTTFVQAEGFAADGIRVAVADSGSHLGVAGGMHADLLGRSPVFLRYGNLANAADQHGHGTHVAGIIAGANALQREDAEGLHYGLGVAPGAEIITQRIFDGDGLFQGPSFQTLARDAILAGARVGNNSWGADTQGRYDVSAFEFDSLVRDADQQTPNAEPYVVVFSAGNSGPRAQSVSSPAVAKNVIAVGASESTRSNFASHSHGPDAIASFSSRGPSEDGRLKPDLVAPGTWIASLRSPLGTAVDAVPIDGDYAYFSGTSQAAPHVSGAAAVFVQYYRETTALEASPALVKAALIHSAVDLGVSGGTGRVPNFDEGWGRADLTQIIRTLRYHEFIDEVNLLSQGQHYARSVVVTATNQPLKITMAYTDFPGFPGAIPALVNDLDLELTAPDGRVFRGNQFEAGQSVPDGPAFDSLNNVEGILINSPLAGEYMLRVRARVVAMDARPDVPGDQQDFALVYSGGIPSPETGAVVLDRKSYTAPSVIRIKLFDIDLAGLPSATVRVRSTTEPAGKLLSLLPLTPNGVFAGNIATAMGPATNSGPLHVFHGDSILVQYFDESENTTNSATAVADLVRPQISAVMTTNRSGRTVVSWQTQEPATSIVRYGTNTSYNRGATNLLLKTTHELELTGLVSGQTYFYSVISSDAAGNTSTNQTNTAFYQFVAEATAPVLLVDAYIYSPGDERIFPSSYTAALNQAGVAYDVWDYSVRQSYPLFNDLRSYAVVIWRLNDSVNRGNDFIPFPQQNAIQQYLNSGGAFFISSMEILTRMLDRGAGAFVTNVLHVQRFDRAPPFPDENCKDCDEDFRVPAIQGASGDIIGNGIFATLNYSAYPLHPFTTLGPDFGDTFGPTTNAFPFLMESVSGKTCGVRFPRSPENSTGRVVFVSFPLDAIPETGDSPNTRAEFLNRALQFLAPGLSGAGSIAFSRSSYKLPDLLTIEVGDSDLKNAGSITVQVASSLESRSVALQETPKSGVFRGILPLVDSTSTNSPGRLRAEPGETLLATYFDASRQITVTAAATVDATSPTISNLTDSAQFQDAEISWTTTEPADALVQFGESALLGKTAYIAETRTNHIVQLSGLAPQRTYYYKVVSRDAAGNTAILDNDGHLYNFQTRSPMGPPLSEGGHPPGAADWSVVNGAGTQSRWRTGSPFNGFVSEAPSGSGPVWASNLLGDPADHIDTTLVSPSIHLTGGNIATLRFWQAYRFNFINGADLVHRGRLLLSTNPYSAPIVLAQYQGSTPVIPSPWEQQEFDLSPYIGHVISLQWHHELDSLQSAARPGWAVDDISLTVSNLTAGTIVVTNNLSQGVAIVRGRATNIAQGFNTVWTGLPGQYAATWSSVPYYQTPPPQTNVMGPGGILVFEGTYTFFDFNNNGISDDWELEFFGEIIDRDCTVDTDQDGFPDCSEFSAGTDPTVPNSLLRLPLPVSVIVSNQPRLRFTWPTRAGRQYQLEGSSSAGLWLPRSFPLYGTATNLSWTIPPPDSEEPTFFRLRVWP